MAADLRPVQSYINLDNIKDESSEMVSIAKQTVADILAEFKKTKKIELGLRYDPNSARQIRLAIEELVKSQKKLEKSVIDLNRIKTEELKRDLQAEKIGRERAKRLQEETKLNDLNAKSKERQAKAARDEEKANAAKDKSTREAIRAYKSLQREYVILKKVAEDYGASLGVESKQYIEAAKRANELNNKLKAIDAGIGNNQRNVGNYISGFNGLSNSFNQISRELPAFANSVQTGFLAISNNLPIFFDEIQRSRKEIAALRAEGKETQGLLSRLGSAFFSFGTILSIGVTLLTVYGKEIGEFFKSIFKGTSALDAFIERQKTINEAFQDSAVKTAFENVTKVGAAFELAKNGVVSKKEALDFYNETLGDTLGKATSLDEAERLYAANSDNYIKATLFRAAAQLALSKAADAALKATEAQIKKSSEFSSFTEFFGSNAGVGSRTGLIDQEAIDKQEKKVAEARERRRQQEIKAEQDKQKTFEQIAQDLFKQSSEFAAKLPNFSLLGDEKKSKKSTDTLKAIKKEFDDSLLKSEQEKNKQLSEIESLFFKTRYDARVKAYQAELDIINGKTNTEIANEKASLDLVLANTKASTNEKINAQREYDSAVSKLTIERNRSILEAQRQFESDVISIKISSYQRQQEIDKDAADLAKEFFEDKGPDKVLERSNTKLTQALERRKNFLNADASDRLRRLEENFQKEFEVVKDQPDELRKLEEDTALKRLRIQNDTNQSLLLAELDYANQYLNVLKSLGIDTVEAEARIAELRLKVKQQETKTLTDENAKQIKIEEDRIAKYKELGNAAKELLTSAIQGVFDRRKNEIQDEINALEKKKQKDIEVANQTITNEQERAAAITTINARAAAQKDQLEQKQRKVDQDRARFERIRSIVDIAQNTAIAISAQLKGLPATAPIIALIGAIGAAQIAAVLARPIPKYATGTDDHPGGPAIVGDGGKSELVVTPEGKMIRTPAVPTLLDMPKHSIVLPDADKATSMLALTALQSIRRFDRPDRSAKKEDELKREIIRLQHIIASKETVQPYIKNGDIRTIIRQGASWVDYINRSV